MGSNLVPYDYKSNEPSIMPEQSIMNLFYLLVKPGLASISCDVVRHRMVNRKIYHSNEYRRKFLNMTKNC